MPVFIIDYGMSNLGSIKRALEECGADVVISDDPKDIKLADRIVLPGVGAFADGMRNLAKGGWLDSLKEEVIENKIPLLGICLGMQLLSTKGYEGRETQGLGFIRGTVERLAALEPQERIPHVGWNEVFKKRESVLFNKIPDGTDFYFVHSYHFLAENKENIIATTPYCGGFTSAVSLNNIFGVQFHPEKSIPAGFQLLRNFLEF